MLTCLKYAASRCTWLASSIDAGTRSICTSVPLKFRLTAGLSAEPLKKKKRMDPAIIKAREEKKKRRLEKMIRKLEKSSQQLKPLDECQIPPEIIDHPKDRVRPPPKLSEETLNDRALSFKQWSSYKYKQYLFDIQNIDRIMQAQQWALDELKNEDIELYSAAIQIDESFLPFQDRGPVETPPLEIYDSPDGEYIDVSRKWQ